MILETIVVVTAVVVVTTAFHLALPSPAANTQRGIVPSPPGTPADPRACLHVAVLGPVQASMDGEPLRLSARLVELLVFLATHPAGVTEGEIRTALWGDRPSSSGALRNLVWQLRRQVGQTDAGEPLVAFADEHGKYRLHPDVVCDLAELNATTGSSGASGRLASVRGRPFDCRRGFEWAHSEGLVAWAESRIVAIAEELAEDALRRGDGLGALRSTEQALIGVPEDERLHRLLLRACASLEDRGAVERAMGRVLGIIGAPDPWASVDPDTLETYLAAGGRHAPMTSREPTS